MQATAAPSRLAQGGATPLKTVARAQRARFNRTGDLWELAENVLGPGRCERWWGAAATVVSAAANPVAPSLPPPGCAVRSQAVQAPTKSDVGNVNDVGLKDVPLRSLFPEEPAPPRAVRGGVVARAAGRYLAYNPFHRLYPPACP